MKISYKLKLLFAFVVIIAGGFLLSRLAHTSNDIPSEFTEARMQGALIAQNIVDLTNQMSKDLEQVNSYDSEKKYTEALELTTDLLIRSQRVREQAVGLSDELRKMTSALSSIESQDARSAALESIASRLALMSRLINYSDYLAQLLTALQTKFSGAYTGDNQVASLIYQINAEVLAINNSNRQAMTAMERFDAIINN